MATVSTRIVTVPNVLSFVRLAAHAGLPVAPRSTAQYGMARSSCWSSRASPTSSTATSRARFNQVSRARPAARPRRRPALHLRDAHRPGLAASSCRGGCVIVIVARDVLLPVLGVVLANHGYGPLPVHHLGKMATFCLFYALPILVLGAGLPGARAGDAIRSAGRSRSGAPSSTGGRARSTCIETVTIGSDSARVAPSAPSDTLEQLKEGRDGRRRH